MDIDKLRKDYETAEAARVKLDGEYEAKRVALKERYVHRLNKVGQASADAQKTLCDAEAALALLGRDDGETIARDNGLLPMLRQIDPRNDAIIRRNTTDGDTDWASVEDEIATREAKAAAGETE